MANDTMPPALTPEREAEAVEIACEAFYAPTWGKRSSDDRFIGRGKMQHALAALRDAGFVVLHADDLTVERRHVEHEVEGWESTTVRLVTAWQEVER